MAGLEEGLRQCDDAYERAQAVTAKFAQIIDNPADLEILYHLNVRTVLSFDVARRWLRQVANFHQGKPYTLPNWGPVTPSISGTFGWVKGESDKYDSELWKDL